jgi:hypothetical protein
LLANVPGFEAAATEDGGREYPALKMLEDYVRTGGGLGIFPGDLTKHSFYNDVMYRDGRGLLPLPLIDRPVPLPDPDVYVSLDPAGMAPVHMLRAFAGRGSAFSRLLCFHVFVHAADTTGTGTTGSGQREVLARFDNGLPALARLRYGRGMVLMWYSAADAKWSNWPRDLTFVPVMNDMVWELARRTGENRDALVGRSITHTLPKRFSGVTAAFLKTPAYPRQDIRTLTIREQGRRRTVTYPDAFSAGVYELTLVSADRTERRHFFARRSDPVESNLAKATQADLAAVVQRPHRYIGNLAAEAAKVEDGPRRKAIWWYFMVLLMAVLFIENILSRRFAHYPTPSRNPRELVP